MRLMVLDKEWVASKGTIRVISNMAMEVRDSSRATTSSSMDISSRASQANSSRPHSHRLDRVTDRRLELRWAGTLLLEEPFHNTDQKNGHWHDSKMAMKNEAWLEHGLVSPPFFDTICYGVLCGCLFGGVVNVARVFNVIMTRMSYCCYIPLL